MSTDKVKTYLNDINARERIDDSEYKRLINKKRFKPVKRNLKLHERIENKRDDTLDDILKRNSY